VDVDPSGVALTRNQVSLHEPRPEVGVTKTEVDNWHGTTEKGTILEKLMDIHLMNEDNYLRSRSMTYGERGR
jgi:hypothetical protein